MAVSEKTTLRRQKWKREILSIIRSTPQASRISVKRQSALSMDSTLSLIEELLDERLIVSVGKSDSGKAGRKATLLEINPEGAYFIGVRFSAAGISGALIDFSCTPVASVRREFSSSVNESELVEGVLSSISELIAHLGENKPLLRGIGLGAPGVINLDNGSIVRYVHMPDIRHLPLRQIVEARFDVPTYLEHGVKCSARSALSLPRFSACRDLIFMQTGRGIHMCVVINGQIHRGANYLSGEIGHMLAAGGRSVEASTSSSALCERAQDALRRGAPEFFLLKSITNGPMTLECLISAAARGCRGCQSLLQEAGKAAGTALANAVMMINPQDIILNGTLCSSPFFESAVRRTLEECCIPESLSGVQLSFLASDPRLDATGAAMIPFHRQFSASRESDPE